ncbi:proton channel OtopLc isoform X4 [Halyomorpha halys]|uniref:proton channel OtopLc isoform X4 n=2 Tax=Halyomorpha halys TaxID=286706 RepID=UPI0034D37AE2
MFFPYKASLFEPKKPPDESPKKSKHPPDPPPKKPKRPLPPPAPADGDFNEWKEDCRMQRCPYLHEMKERLLTQPGPDHLLLEPIDAEVMEVHGTGVPTVVKLNSDGYGSHTSPTHHLLPTNSNEHHDDPHSFHPKNAKTSLFIIMSFIYAKLLIVICIAYVVSEVVTHSLPLVYYEGFFTYLYGMSILFLLYVFCFLLQESSCCQGGEPKPPKPKKEKKEKENQKNQKKEKKEKEKEKKEKEKDKKKEAKEKEKEGTPAAAPPPPPVPPQGQRNSRSNIFQNDVYPRKMRDVVRQKSLSDVDGSQMGLGTLKKGKPGCESQSQEKLTQEGGDLEAGVVQISSPGRKRKTSQNTCSHGSFFLRVGAIAFGLATMIYNGLEFGAFFEIPFTSPCYQILRGVNPVLQMVFTFMQMYFIFMNSRLNIHRFKVIARFGLMHIVATNLCVWIRTLVLESLKEISGYLERNLTTASPSTASFANEFPSFGRPAAPEGFRPVLTNVATTPSTTTTTMTAKYFRQTVQTLATSTARAIRSTVLPTIMTTTPTTTTMRPTTTPTTTHISTTLSTTPSTTPFQPFFFNSNLRKNFTEALTQLSTPVSPVINWDHIGDSPLAPQALIDHRSLSSENCERNNIMGTIVQDSAPYLFPFIIEYSLIGAAVIYVMWRHIGRNPRYHGEEELEQRLEVILSRRAVAMAQAQHGGPMDCVGASKGLFLGLLLLVGSLICLILFFVLIHNPIHSLLAIYLADVSHCVLMALSVLAIIVGFIRVQGLKFKGEEQSDLNDILLRVSAFGLFVYSVFSIIAGSLAALTSEPNLLVMITGILSIVQVVLQLLFIADVSRRRVHLPEHDRSKPGRQIVTFLLIANVTMWIIYTFETQKVVANPVQLEFYGFLAWSMVQRLTLPLCIFHRFHSAVTLAEIWKTSYKPRID